MRRGKGNDPEVIAWLESKEGERWSANLGKPARGDDGRKGVFGEVRTDYESCVWHGNCPDHGGSR
jgi:hypothetical protein